jgi:transcriptional regulator with GAF, ATPase, and Fis domain
MDILESWRRLLAKLVSSIDRATAVDDCLDALVDVLEADRGLVLVTDADGEPFALNARGRNRGLTPSERDEVSGSIIRQAMAERRSLVWETADKAPAGSMVRWGIATALAVPLVVPPGNSSQPSRILGALYVDYRVGHKAVSPSHIALFEMASALVSTVLEQTRRRQIADEKVRHFETDATVMRRNAGRPGLDEIITGQGLMGLRQEILSAVHGRSPILILGESGTGKTLLAEAMAEARGGGPVIRAVLGTSDDLNTITSELFGHERGAFSGALARRTGLVELADGGTLIFDELLNLPTSAQKLLLDFTQFGTFRPLGWDKREPKRAEVRLFACTNGDVDAAVADGKLRPDLYYRLAGARIRLPPLRDRRADIPRLAESFLARAYGRKRWLVAEDFLAQLGAANVQWPGNVRQLESVLQRAVERATLDGDRATTLHQRHLAAADLGQIHPAISSAEVSNPDRATGGEPPGEDLLRSWQALRAQREDLDETERRLIAGALARSNGVVAHAARELGTSRTGLLSRMQTLGVSRVKAESPPGSEAVGDSG